MRTLILLRHAKSDWDEPDVADFDRPLSRRGRSAAPRIAAHLRAAGCAPDVVLCSAARRAVQTWALVEPVLAAGASAKILRGLYLAPPGRLLEFIHRVPDHARGAMVIGHNPGMERLAIRLAGPGSEAQALKKLRAKFPTAAAACIEFDTGSWTDVTDGAGRLTRLDRPRDLD